MTDGYLTNKYKKSLLILFCHFTSSFYSYFIYSILIYTIVVEVRDKNITCPFGRHKRLCTLKGIEVSQGKSSITLFLFYKNIVFPIKAEIFYFSADFRLTIFLWTFLDNTVWHLHFSRCIGVSITSVLCPDLYRVTLCTCSIAFRCSQQSQVNAPLIELSKASNIWLGQVFIILLAS